MKTWLIATAIAGCLLGGQARAAETTPAPAQAQAETQTKAQLQAQKADAAAKASGFVIRPVDDAWRTGLPRNAEAATQAYMDRLPADVVAKSDAYYTGGYWLQLWHLMLGLAITALWLSGKRAMRLRDWAARVGRGPLRRDFVFSACYLAIGNLLSLPLTLYEEWWREHAYGMSTQALPAWLGEWAVASTINLLIGSVAFMLLYVLIRRAGERWWIWGTAAAMALLTVLIAVSPVLFEPLFNEYKPVEDGPVKNAVLQMAHANGVPADNVYVFDASRQTTRISANVSGLFGSAAVRLNDNLLRRTSLPEIRAVMAHELGHYVLNHIVKTLCMLALVVLVGFYVVQAVLGWLLRRLAPASGVSRVDDVAALPLLAMAFSLFFALATPIQNTITRVQEAEADEFGLNLSREPHGFAEAQLRLVEYRKADPGPVEEFMFFHHPSTRHRILAAMRWREAIGTP